MPLLSLVTLHWIVTSLGAGRRANFSRSSTAIGDADWNHRGWEWLWLLWQIKLCFSLCRGQFAMSHSFIRFTAWGWTFPVVRVEWSQTRRGFLFFLFLSTSFLPFFDFLFFFLVTYLAPGCGDDMHNSIPCYNLKVTADYKMHWARLLLTCVKLLSPLGRLRDRFVRLLFLLLVSVIMFALLWTFLLHHWLCLLGRSLQ